MKPYPLSIVAAEDVPDDIQNPLLWLMRRLRDGRLQGIKRGNSWYMTQAQRDAIWQESDRKPVVAEPETETSTLTSVSPRRFKRSA